MEPRFHEVIEEALPGPAAETAVADREGYLLTAALRQRLDLIRHLIDFSRQLILVVGDEGAGKTSLLHHLLATAADNWRIAHVSADPMCDSSILLKRLAADFELNYSEGENVERCREEFETFLALTRRAALVPVVMVDDAHLLQANALLLLLHLSQAETEQPSLRVVLFCDPRIMRVLGSPQLQSFKESLTHTVELAPFTLEDTARYLAAHWPAADPESSPILDERYVREVHQASAGIPGRINALVRTSLEQPSPLPEPLLPKATSKRSGWIAAAVAVAALLSIGIWLARPDRNTEIAPQSKPEDSPALVEPVPLKPETAPTQAVTVPVVAAPAAVSPPAAAPPAAIPPPAAPAIPSTDSATSLAPATAAPPTVPPVEAEPEETTTNAPPPVLPPKPMAEKPKPEPSKPHTTEAAKPEKPKPASKPKPAGDHWLQSQPNGNYVLQLYATYQRVSAAQFVSEHNLGAKTRILPTVRDNKTWYVVIYGSYTDHGRAHSAISELPAAVQRLSPWVRKVSDLKAIAADGE
jgi:DamX protein